MHGSVAFFAPSSAGVAASSLHSVGATGLETLPNRAASDSKYPRMIDSLSDPAEILGGDYDGALI